LFERNNSVGKAGDYFADEVGAHAHPDMLKLLAGGVNHYTTTGSGRMAMQPVAANPGTETRPKNYLINKYVLI